MLVLSRKEGDRIVIGEGVDRIEVVIAYVRGERVGVAIEAPKEVKIMRAKLINRETVK